MGRALRRAWSLASSVVTKRRDFICPSSEPKVGAELLGVVLGEGKAAILPSTIPLDHTFFAKGAEVGPLDERFKFANRCAKNGCDKWTGERCGLIDKLVETDRRRAEAPEQCSIRTSCRWYSQHGRAACEICPTIVLQQRINL